MNGRTWWQRAVARGYAPLPEPALSVTLVGPGHEATVRLPEQGLPGGFALPAGGLGVLLPTYVARCGPQAQSTALRHLLDALVPVRRAHPDLPLTVWVGMQYGSGERAEAVRRLRALTVLAPPAGATVVGIALPGPGKPRTINAAVRLSRSLGYRGWLWTDDDVRFAGDCLERLVTRFRERGWSGAVGSRVTTLSRATPAARTMHRVSGTTVPPDAYPVAACMVVATGVIAAGIPARRLADDGHVLFELLDVAAADPLHDLEVLPDAVSLVHRPARARDTVRRLRRSLYSHTTCMADYPRPVAAHYFSAILFHGLWPLARWDGSRGTRRGLVRWAVKAVHLGWLCAVAAGLAVRGAAGRPLRSVAWGDEGDFRSPVAGGPHPHEDSDGGDGGAAARRTAAG